MKLHISSSSQTFSNLSTQISAPSLPQICPCIGKRETALVDCIWELRSLLARGLFPSLPVAPETLGNHWCSMEPSLRIDLKGSAIRPLLPSVFCYVFHRILSRILTSALWRKDSGIIPWPAKIDMLSLELAHTWIFLRWKRWCTKRQELDKR